jgi:hydroxylamine reductase (hybrid-cluster protein)
LTFTPGAALSDSSIFLCLCRQKADFAKFPGSILVTTNCVLDPLPSYRENLFTTNEVILLCGLQRVDKCKYTMQNRP